MTKTILTLSALATALLAVGDAYAATAGFTGGHVKTPGYARVCLGNTGHAEAVDIEYDPGRVSYRTLLDVFWSLANPTARDRDPGYQYRSAILYHDEDRPRSRFLSGRGLSPEVLREAKRRALASLTNCCRMCRK